MAASADTQAFPELDPHVEDEVNAMLTRLVSTQWGEAICQSRRLVRATLDGNTGARRELHRSARLLKSAGY